MVEWFSGRFLRALQKVNAFDHLIWIQIKSEVRGFHGLQIEYSRQAYVHEIALFVRYAFNAPLEDGLFEWEVEVVLSHNRDLGALTKELCGDNLEDTFFDVASEWTSSKLEMCEPFYTTGQPLKPVLKYNTIASINTPVLKRIWANLIGPKPGTTQD